MLEQDISFVMMVIFSVAPDLLKKLTISNFQGGL